MVESPIARHAGLAIHVAADVMDVEPYRHWAALVTARDTVASVARLCQSAGITEQRTLVGEQATRAALSAQLAAAARELRDGGVLVLTFSGHTERGEWPIETTRWCLCDGPIGVAEVAAQLARLPAGVRVVVIVDSCYAAALRQVTLGPQPLLLIGGCQEEQTVLERVRSEIIVRLEQLFEPRADVAAPAPSVLAVKAWLEADTPDAERPCVWTNWEPWWTADALPASP